MRYSLCIEFNAPFFYGTGKSPIKSFLFLCVLFSSDFTDISGNKLWLWRFRSFIYITTPSPSPFSFLLFLFSFIASRSAIFYGLIKVPSFSFSALVLCSTSALSCFVSAAIKFFIAPNPRAPFIFWRFIGDLPTSAFSGPYSFRSARRTGKRRGEFFKFKRVFLTKTF